MIMRLATAIARKLGEHGLFVWHGDFYAAHFVKLAGLSEHGDSLRIGLSPCSATDEVERMILAVRELARRDA
jgi:selenocysteine lyase/cysteine desulfurase